MALVAYGSSGDSDSDYDDEPSVPTSPKSTTVTAPTTTATQLDDTPDAIHPSTSLAFHLPSPKTVPSIASNQLIDEEDDEFLRKKPLAYAIERPPPPPKPLTKAPSGPVKILLPALSSFAEHKQKERPLIGAELPINKPTGLINMLPKPKLMQFGQKTSTGGGKASTSLVPDSISRPKRPTTTAMKKPAQAKPAAASVTKAAASNDSDDDSDSGDFFSLNIDEQLPEVSAAEIAAMVASKSAQMGRASRDLQQEQQNIAAEIAAAAAVADAAAAAGPSTSAGNASGAMDQQAIAALCGSRQASKRSRHATAELSNIIDISGDQVLPDRDEWLRQQLTGTTEYQPRGLVDGDPGAGTKRKHQITYLAHQAKANEQELQAMWAANRNTRRQTQNKYGF